MQSLRDGALFSGPWVSTKPAPKAPDRDKHRQFPGMICRLAAPNSALLCIYCVEWDVAAFWSLPPLGSIRFPMNQGLYYLTFSGPSAGSGLSCWRVASTASVKCCGGLSKIQ